MEDLIAVARVLIALAFYLTAYILPPALVLSAVIRLALRWHCGWWLVLASLLTALLQIYLISTVAPQNVAYFLGTAASVVSAIFYILGTRGHKDGIKLLLDIALFIIVLVYTVMNVDWVVG